MKKDNKTVNLTVYFFTNKLPAKIDNQIPFWPNGSIHLKANKTKGIKSQEAIINSIEEIPSVIRSLLSKANLVAMPNPKTKNKAK